MTTKNTKKKMWTIAGIAGVTAVLAAAYSYSGPINMSASLVKAQSKTIPSPIGYFRFSDDSRIDQTNLAGTYIRLGVTGMIGEDGKISLLDPEGRQTQAINDLLAEGKKVIPSIRIKSPATGECDTVPDDLVRTGPLRAKTIYSEKVAAFVKDFAHEFKGKFPIVVYGNEQNSETFFCASQQTEEKEPMEIEAAKDYIRMLSTVRTAYQEVDPKAKFADGGIQGQILGLLLVDQYLQEGQTDKAVSFYNKLMGEELNLEDVQKDIKSLGVHQRSYIRAKALLDLNLYSYVNLVNYHHYQASQTLAEIDEFLVAKSKGKTRITNEIGAKAKFDEGSRAFAMKFFDLASRGYPAIVWFSNEASDLSNAGAFVTGEGVGEIVEHNKKAFEMVARYLGRRYSTIRNLSTETVGKVVVTYPDGSSVDVLWPIGVPEFEIPAIEENCIPYNHLGYRIPNDQPTSEIPVYIACNENRPPVAIAKMSVDGGATYSTTVTVRRHELVNVRLSAGEKGSAGSYDPDKWDNPKQGVSIGGKIEWNADLDTDHQTTYEYMKKNPAYPISADLNLGMKNFTRAPGTYTYNLLKITDAAGAVSDIGTVTVIVLPAGD
jgi:hypothetical protein